MKAAADQNRNMKTNGSKLSTVSMAMTIAIDLSRTVAVMLHEHGEIIENYRDFNGCRFLVLV